MDSDPSMFTALFSGEKDNGNHGIDKKRKKFYELMTQSHIFYENLLSHCYNIIDLNTKIQVYKKNNIRVNDISISTELCEENDLCYQSTKAEISQNLNNVFKLSSLKQELLDDKRLSNNLKQYIIKMVGEDFSIALSWLIITAFLGDTANSRDEIAKIEKLYIDFEKNNEKIKNGHTLFLEQYDNLANKFINALLSCETKWGPYSDDKTAQNANVCEGGLALCSVQSEYDNKEYIMGALQYLDTQKNENGIPSKSLNERTVVPTSMYLYFISYLYEQNWIDEDSWSDTCNIAKNLWNVRNKDGWGIYVMQHQNSMCNIGCTYWVLRAIDKYKNCINGYEYYGFIESLFRYHEINLFGSSLNETTHNGCRIKLYATAMMLYLYFICDDNTQRKIDKKYNYREALTYIQNNFDAQEYISEIEEIDGTDEAENVSVHYVSWTHITLRYCIDAITEAIKQNKLSESEVDNFLRRLCKIIKANIFEKNLIAYWVDRNKIFEREGRGYLIFPTMHILMSLANLKETINNK